MAAEKSTSSAYNAICGLLSDIEGLVNIAFRKSPKEVALRKMSKLLREMNSMDVNDKKKDKRN